MILSLPLSENTQNTGIDECSMTTSEEQQGCVYALCLIRSQHVLSAVDKMFPPVFPLVPHVVGGLLPPYPIAFGDLLL